MPAQQSFQDRFTQVYYPVFKWGVAALELALILWTLYMEYRTGAGPSLLYTVLPLSIAIAVMWAVLSVLVTLFILGVKSRAEDNGSS